MKDANNKPESGKATTVWVDAETIAVFRELSERSHIPQTDILKDIAIETKKLLDSVRTERVSFAVVQDERRKVVLIGILPMQVFSIPNVPNEVSDSEVDKRIRKEIEKRSKT